MDTLSYDGYTSYSDASTPRTPSPTDMHFAQQPYKHDLDHPVRALFAEEDQHQVLVNHDYQQGPFAFNQRGSLLQELYDSDIDHSLSPEVPFQQDSWAHQQQQQQQQLRPTEYSMVRRATFPYVRQDREDGMPMQQYPPFMQQQQQQQMDTHYAYRQDLYDHPESFMSSPHSSYTDFDADHSIKLEDATPPMVPSQTFYSSGPNHHPNHPHHGHHGHPHMNMTYLSPHTGLPVQHTDDAASKETQYLRRRCFNCHTTEPPSWRRSTLNPGKIVCNKCGLYERTHLRPRPLRFDELRAGNKARKQSKAGAQAAAGGAGAQGGNAGGSPKQKLVKKEFGAGALVRRASVSSSASSIHSGSGASDWDDNVSVYSSGSAPPTSFSSPVQHPFPLGRDSQSPPHDGATAIRVPTNPLSDLASLNMHHLHQQHQQQQHGLQLQQHQLPLPTPRKAHTSPAYYSNTTNGNGAGSAHGSPALGGSPAADAYFGNESNSVAGSATNSPQTLAATIAVGPA